MVLVRLALTNENAKTQQNSKRIKTPVKDCAANMCLCKLSCFSIAGFFLVVRTSVRVNKDSVSESKHTQRAFSEGCVWHYTVKKPSRF